MNEYRALLDMVDGKLAVKPRVVLAVDGNSGSGKSKTAARLQEDRGAAVIHMDDFFLPVHLRTPARYREAGGNVHYERFMEQIAEPLLHGDTYVEQRFDCGAMRLGRKRTLSAKRLVVVEGVYSLRPEFLPLYDLRAFLHCAKAMQMQRIAAREGAEAQTMFAARWIPLEEAYFAAYQPWTNCDLLWETDRGGEGDATPPMRFDPSLRIGLFQAGSLQHYRFVVVFTFLNGKLLLSRQSTRGTWETQGGHVERGECPMQAAVRELHEEAGVKAHEIKPIFDYRVTAAGEETSGMAFMADVSETDCLPPFEMCARGLFERLPHELTYPQITPVLYAEVLKRRGVFLTNR